MLRIFARIIIKMVQNKCYQLMHEGNQLKVTRTDFDNGLQKRMKIKFYESKTMKGLESPLKVKLNYQNNKCRDNFEIQRGPKLYSSQVGNGFKLFLPNARILLRFSISCYQCLPKNGKRFSSLSQNFILS